LSKSRSIASDLFSRARQITKLSRDQLLDLSSDIRKLRNLWIKYQITVNRRFDILANILGYEVIPTLHWKILSHQAKTKQSLVLAFRGAGKTTAATITNAIGEILCYPDVRILIASKTLDNSKAFLKDIKGHFESNEDLREIFGDFVGKKEWNDRSIEVSKKTKITKEPTIMTVGAEGAVASKHYDILFVDDLVEMDNSRTEHMRTKLKTWYYSVLIPTLEPPDENVYCRGTLRISGTRYNPDDLYDHLQRRELSEGKTLIIPALDENNISSWPAKFPAEFFENKRETMGQMIFDAQYQCSCDAMQGELFRYNNFEQHKEDEYPPQNEMAVYMGVDLAIGQKESHDMFAIVVVGIKDGHVWVLDFFEGHLRFNEQVNKILSVYSKYDPIYCAIEVNAYQKSIMHALKEKDIHFRGFPIQTDKDKVTRAQKRTPLFEQGKVHFLLSHQPLMDRFVTRSSGVDKNWDLFDAFDFALTPTPLSRRIRKERPSFGLL
jgi:phage terminase large subunit-like protein